MELTSALFSQGQLVHHSAAPGAVGCYMTFSHLSKTRLAPPCPPKACPLQNSSTVLSSTLYASEKKGFFLKTKHGKTENYVRTEEKRSQGDCQSSGSMVIGYELKGCQFVGLGAW